MKTRSATLTVAADPDAVFAYVSRRENLPRWAAALTRELRADGGQWRARTPGGDEYLALVADARTGVIDLFVGMQPDEMTLIPLRVIGRPRGAAVMVTLLQPAEWADELFEQYFAALLDGLRRLAALYRGGRVQADGGAGEPFYPSLVTARFEETWAFYTALLGFRTHAECGAYVHLVHPSGAQLGLLREETDERHPELVSGAEGRGFWLNLDVADADAEHERLRGAGVEIVDGLADQPWGDRQFVIRDPNGVLIAIAHRIAAAAEQLMEA